MQWKIIVSVIFSTLGILETRVEYPMDMVPAWAGIGESADLYCSTGYNSDYARYVRWSRSNNTHEETITTEAGSRFKVTDIMFQGLKLNENDWDSFCLVLKPQLGNSTDDSFMPLCKTSVLTVSNVSAEDYSMTYNCYFHNNQMTRHSSAKIFRPENETVDFVFSRGQENVAQCTANHNITWFISFDNKTLANITEPEKLLPKSWISEDLFEQIYSSTRNNTFYESLIILHRNRILQSVFLFCGTHVESAVYASSVGSMNRYPRYKDMWDEARIVHSWRVAYAFPALFLVAGIIALKRAGFFQTVCICCCNILTVLIAQYRQASAMSGARYNYSYQPISTADLRKEEVENVESESSVILDLTP